MELLGGLAPGHLRALDHRLGGRLVDALRRILEAARRPTLNVSWVGEHRRWRVVVRGLDEDDQVGEEIVLEVAAGPDAGPDVATLTLIHLASTTFREDLVRDVLQPDDPRGGPRCPAS